MSILIGAHYCGCRPHRDTVWHDWYLVTNSCREWGQEAFKQAFLIWNSTKSYSVASTLSIKCEGTKPYINLRLINLFGCNLMSVWQRLLFCAKKITSGGIHLHWYLIFFKVVLYKLLFISVVWSYRSPFSKASICVNNCLCVFSPGKHEEKQDEGGIVTKNFTKKIQ